ncbi:MAG TPA: hypothetical protein VIJ65_09035 [Acidobacteriaceae bacterium]
MSLLQILGRRKKEALQVNPSTRLLGQIDLDNFLEISRENITHLKAFLGDESFVALRVIDRKIPSAGETILSEAHGLRPKTIAENLQKFVERLDTGIDLLITQTPSQEITTVWEFIRRIDDIADLGVLVGGQANEYVHNLSEYHLSLINYLQRHLTEEGIDKLIKRFSAREALRAERLVPYWAVNQDSAAR